MLDSVDHEKGYQGYVDMERAKWHETRHSYWKDIAVELNTENIELKLKIMALESRYRIYGVCVSVGAALLLAAVLMGYCGVV